MAATGRYAVGAFIAVVLAAIAGKIYSSPIALRLVRNAGLGKVPVPVEPKYGHCSDADLVEKVSFVVTVKDTCGQAGDLLGYLAEMFPKGIHVHYAYPAIRGCRHVPIREIGERLFDNFTVSEIAAHEAPIAGFLKVQPLLKTPYAVLMHNDAFPMERQFACELYRALEANPHYPIAAPQIYEKGDTDILVPHGHHENLHVRPTATGDKHRIDYDLSVDLLTMREPEDFREMPQPDFLEDHAFMARSDVYHDLLDERGSFTMEYMDMALNMRARNTSAWYVPTARCYFDVSISKLTWEDMPYFMFKRSEQVGLQVRQYLTNKWGIEFPNTGIWNFVRYVFFADIVFPREAMPEDWKDQAAVFYSWFEAGGFNRYNGQILPFAVEEPANGKVTISRTIVQELETDVLPHRVPPQAAMEVLPVQKQKSVGKPEIAFKEPHLPIAMNVRSCNAGDEDTWRSCGLAVQDGNECKCYTYVNAFNLRTTLYIDRLMDLLKLPTRAFMYAQMKYFNTHIAKDDVDFYCSSTQAECTVEVNFGENSRILQWSWFGPQTKYPLTMEGLLFLGTLLTASWVVFNSHRIFRLFGVSKQRVKEFKNINKLVCETASSRM
eukprot:TRINITY_DN111782_c0_g1_i1.p1 TRINITY_DN111782_c0_g1~~TRINITY_DN111782_c0_g1_i1.p1  ORF type:complete len:607 (-),score=151.25 TRINITY_DN111782_c0_g1_i1:227-2047(-)